MLKVLAVMTGGGLGASLRYGLFLVIQRLAGSAFPVGTLIINLLGSLLIGYLWSLFEEVHFVREWRLFLFTGLLGGFTTFSTFTREAVQLLQTGAWKAAIFYILASNILGVACVFCGYFLYRWAPLLTR
jgi:CrcB protein